MAVIELKESQIPQSVSTGLFKEKLIDIAPNMTEMLIDVLVSAVTQALADLKSTDIPVAFKFCKSNGDFIAGAVVQYFPNEDKSNPGNWNYSWTFDESDIPENASIKTPYDSAVASYFRGSSLSKYGFHAPQAEYYGDTMSYILSVIKKWLDENASADEEQCVKVDGIIQFRVAIEDGEKVFSAEPDGEIKQIIKSDKDIEV